MTPEFNKIMSNIVLDHLEFVFSILDGASMSSSEEDMKSFIQRVRRSTCVMHSLTSQDKIDFRKLIYTYFKKVFSSCSVQCLHTSKQTKIYITFTGEFDNTDTSNVFSIFYSTFKQVFAIPYQNGCREPYVGHMMSHDMRNGDYDSLIGSRICITRSRADKDFLAILDSMNDNHVSGILTYQLLSLIDTIN